MLEAVKNEPTLVPAAALAGRLLGEAGELRRAARVVEAAWKANPHPDLADAYAHLQPGDSARDRLKRMEVAGEKAPGNIEGALAVARAALDAQEFAIARRALAPLLIVPTQRVAMLMAELEEKEHGDEGRAREWMTRALNGAARSGLDRGRHRVRPLDAGVAGHRPARCLPVEGSDRRGGCRGRADRAREARVAVPAAAADAGAACAEAPPRPPEPAPPPADQETPPRVAEIDYARVPAAHVDLRRRAACHRSGRGLARAPRRPRFRSRR